MNALAGDGPVLLPQVWTRPTIDFDAADVLARIERGLTVGLIATPRERLQTCKADDPLEEAVARPEVERFDFLPVLKDDKFIGLLHRAPFVNGNRVPDGRAVAEFVEPLSETNLIGADAGILAFVRTADRMPCRLVFGDAEISGMVTLSDMQKLPVRPVLFLLITQLELLMYECIKTVYNGDSWLARLPKDQQDRVERFWTRQHDENSDVDKLLVTSLGHKATIIEATPSLSPISTSFSGFKPIVDLRDQLAHAKDYAGTPSTARVTCQIVRRIEELVQQLSDRLKKKASP